MAPDEQPKEKEEIKQAFEDTLNTHGYAFQRKVLDDIGHLPKSLYGKWLIEVPEFPVAIHSRDTRIDFILKHSLNSGYMICECKRVNPAYGYWLFAKSPTWSRAGDRRLENVGYHQTIWCDPRGNSYEMELWSLETASYPVCDIGIEIKRQTIKGDKSPGHVTGTGAIEDAVTQVVGGMSGLIEFCKERHLLHHTRFGFFPAIITTAELWVSDVDLLETNVTTGDVSLYNTQVDKKNWLFFRYPVGRGLRHSITPKHLAYQLGNILDTEFAVDVAIVNVSGIEDFMSARFWMNLPPKEMDRD